MGRFIFVSFGLLVVFLSLSGTAADCPSDWSTHGQYCYRVFQQKMNWDDAERFCSEQAKGGHLVFIENSGEKSFVSDLITDNIQSGDLYAWIGLRIENKEKQCSSKWSDGSSLSYENLVERSVKKCFAMHKPFGFTRWVNIYCAKKNPFVCKSPPQ